MTNRLVTIDGYQATASLTWDHNDLVYTPYHVAGRDVHALNLGMA